MGTAMITLRPFVASDVAEAVALEEVAQPTPWSPRMFTDELGAESRHYSAVEAGGALIGFGGIMVAGEEAHVMNLLVSPGWRRRGVARRLMAALVEAALVMGARHLTLEVRSKNKAAIALYRDFGLAPVGMRRGYYSDDDALIMWAHDIDATGDPELQR